MNTKDVIYELRTKNGLSQDELAEKVFVTRQAVSRWENGETVPNTEALKLLSNLFRVSINTLLGSPQKLICQCCGMPLEDEIIGRTERSTKIIANGAMPTEPTPTVIWMILSMFVSNTWSMIILPKNRRAPT